MVWNTLAWHYLLSNHYILLQLVKRPSYSGLFAVKNLITSTRSTCVKLSTHSHRWWLDKSLAFVFHLPAYVQRFSKVSVKSADFLKMQGYPTRLWLAHGVFVLAFAIGEKLCHVSLMSFNRAIFFARCVNAMYIVHAWKWLKKGKEGMENQSESVKKAKVEHIFSYTYWKTLSTCVFAFHLNMSLRVLSLCSE